MAEQQPVTDFYTDKRTRDRVDQRIREYLGFFDKSGAAAESRKAKYATMINDFYDVVTDFYEFGWNQSFHFAARFKGESFEASLARAEYFLASRLGLRPGVTVLDVGCGIGGPMRNIARFSGSTVVGVNNNDYQLAKLERYNEAAGLGGQCSGFKGDFMALKVEDETYDAAYTIEASCHAPDKAVAFREVARVLKPGALFAGYEWCMTDLFEPENSTHRQIKTDIETGNSLPDIATVPELTRALQLGGFEVLDVEDRVKSSDPETPWHLPLKGERFSATALRRSAVGRAVTNRGLAALETLRIAPKGSTAVSNMLNLAADSLVKAGDLGIFTPNLFFLARRSA
ncbi:MAG: methyltransferase domain-containing protein [Proteobacteria bacterium]|nr:methyltransferase domain-containing protein [Pseudomonadota bacterium]